jgi:hypothetical protein
MLTCFTPEHPVRGIADMAEELDLDRSTTHMQPKPTDPQVMRQDQPTDAMLAVPSEIVPYLRRGLFGEWGFAAEDISNRALQFGSGARSNSYQEPLRTFDAARALLDEIGWRDNKSQTDVAINLSLHHQLVLRALRMEHLVLVDQLAETPRVTSKQAHDSVSTRTEALGEFVKQVKAQARLLGLAEPQAASQMIIPPRIEPSRTHRRRR